MKWLGYGWRSEPGPGASVLVNGQKLCTLSTMKALQKVGYVIQGDDGCWKASQSGKSLTGRLCL